jgi:hypothetical protein
MNGLIRRSTRCQDYCPAHSTLLQAGGAVRTRGCGVGPPESQANPCHTGPDLNWVEPPDEINTLIVTAEVHEFEVLFTDDTSAA